MTDRDVEFTSQPYKKLVENHESEQQQYSPQPYQIGQPPPPSQPPPPQHQQYSSQPQLSPQQPGNQQYSPQPYQTGQPPPPSQSPPPQHQQYSSQPQLSPQQPGNQREHMVQPLMSSSSPNKPVPHWPSQIPLDMRPASNLIDPVRYPKSTELYQALVTKFGAQNIVPLPQFLANTSDKSRKRWYKCDANAQLYFMHRSDTKYKAQVQKMIDLGFCANCCCYDELWRSVKKYTWRSICSVCFNEWNIWASCCILGPCSNITLPYHFMIMNPVSDQSIPDSMCTCGQAKDNRFDFLSRLQASGFKVDIPSKCCIYMQVIWCNCCAAMQQEAVVTYVYSKRYGYKYGIGQPEIRKNVYHGADQLWKSYYDAVGPNPLFHIQDFSNIGLTQSDHFKEKDYDNVELGCCEQFNQNFGTRMSREAVHETIRPLDPLMMEWFNPNKAIANHNARWNGSHITQIQVASPMQMI